MRKVEYSNITGIKYIGEDFMTWKQDSNKSKQPKKEIKPIIKKAKVKKYDSSRSSERD